MIRKNLKGFTIGVVVTLILMNSITYASGNKNLIEVLFNDVNITTNGENVALSGESYTLSNGEEVPYSMIYKGTTYLPIRKIAEILERNVSWEGNTKTVGINDEDYFELENVEDDNLVDIGSIEAVKIEDKYYNFQYYINNVYLNGNGSIYQSKESSVVPLIVALLSKNYSIQETDNPNLGGQIRINWDDAREYEVWFEYKGIERFEMKSITYYSKDKAKYYKLDYEGSNVLSTSQDGVDSVIRINNDNYFNANGILNYLGYNNYRVYYDNNIECCVVEIIE